MTSRTCLAVAAFALALAIAAAPAHAQSRCRVTDPTGTPLNIRATPNGQIIGRAANGVLVSIVDTASDTRGRAWALIRPASGGGAVGWVFREFVSCF
jgi:hypothetical protein